MGPFSSQPCSFTRVLHLHSPADDVQRIGGGLGKDAGASATEPCKKMESNDMAASARPPQKKKQTFPSRQPFLFWRC